LRWIAAYALEERMAKLNRSDEGDTLTYPLFADFATKRQDFVSPRNPYNWPS
jgi:hypothetical protein